MATLTKKNLVDAVAQETGESRRNVKNLLEVLLDAISRELGSGVPVHIGAFGTFEIRRRQARSVQNPKTLERIIVPAKSVVKFRPGPWLKGVVKNPDTHLKLDRPEIPPGIATRVERSTPLPESMHRAVFASIFGTIGTALAARSRVEFRDFGAFELSAKQQVLFRSSSFLAEMVDSVVIDESADAGSSAGATAIDSEFGVWIDPGGADSEDVAAVFSALSDLHRAAGGRGLIFSAKGSSSYIMAEDCQ